MTASNEPYRHVDNLSPLVPVAWDTDELIVWARLYPDTWNGFACPAFDRENAEKVVEATNRLHAQDAESYPETFHWAGDVLLGKDDRPGYEGDDWYDPVVDETGTLRWPIGARAWTWTVVPRCPHCKEPVPWGTLVERPEWTPPEGAPV